eukprot:TRINITY_DN2606_c1_g1_i1.p1 TRINITY_DN2606_c1_g1~~TRINITY_DN2606_c1_g1_i1.p1  ORF type:complete len:259 (+),score=79.81 TRINITY_DN2606_c1_g1_i1:168-944(+)
MIFEDLSFPTSIDGIGDEVLSCFLSLGLAALIYGIWRSTSVTDSGEEVRGSNEVPRRGGEEEEEEEETSNEESSREDPHETEEALGSEADDDDSSRDSARIRLKFLDERVKEVRSHLGESFGRFKRRHFARELQENQLIRIVFNGRFLQGDSSSLSSLGLFDDCVCHVLIQEAPPPPSSPTNNAQPSSNRGSQSNNTAPGLVTEDLDLSTLCYPLLGSLLSLTWWCQIVYGQYFNLTSTLSLIFITGLYVFCLAVQLY